MKKIQAIIRTSKFEEVRNALHQSGIEIFTYYDVKDAVFHRESKGAYRGTYVVDNASVPRRALEILVPAEDCSEVVETIRKAASTGQVGDGKIVIFDVAEIVRI
jgi:nitrogen regulatory protein PII